MHYELDDFDLEAIDRAHRDGGDPWCSKHIERLKRRIKNHCRVELGEVCCYCVRNTFGEHNYVLHVEHVLPRSHADFSQYIFEPRNLSVSCFRCNAGIKKADISFLTRLEDAQRRPFESETYKFIHPNLDVYFDHLSYEATFRNASRYIKYFVVNRSTKGEFTYSYFKLDELETDSYSNGQGAAKNVALSTNIPADIVNEIERITALPL
ncbi:MAG: HNH endonuclease [Gammaproteobacteria bacterium]|nr:HNH endonuclease [Gammaproteobacteria bacterium]